MKSTRDKTEKKVKSTIAKAKGKTSRVKRKTKASLTRRKQPKHRDVKKARKIKRKHLG